MTPGLLGAPVYAKGYIKSYARFLGMDEQTTLDRYLSECAAILKDPEKVEIRPAGLVQGAQAPRSPALVLGVLVVALVGAGAMLMLDTGGKSTVGRHGYVFRNVGCWRCRRTRRSATAHRRDQGRPSALSAHPTARNSLIAISTPTRPTPRVLGLGGRSPQRMVPLSNGVSATSRSVLMQAEGGPVYSQNVDLAAQRQPIVVAAAGRPDGDDRRWPA